MPHWAGVGAGVGFEARVFMIGKMLIMGFICAGMAMGQSSTAPVATAAVKPLAFDVVSIRPSGPNTLSRPMQISADSYRVTMAALIWEIMRAYVPQVGGAVAFREDDVKGYPSWVTTERYDIDARVPEADLAEWQKPASQPAMLRAMLQQMLVERCKLAVHREFKERDVYALVVAKGGPKLKETNPEETHPPGIVLPGGGVVVNTPSSGLILYGASVKSFLSFVASTVGSDRPIQDKTGLTGRYDIVLSKPKPSPDSGPGEQKDGPSASDPGPTPFSFMKGLGLELVPTKGTVETLVIDHVERPSEN
jgi:bla regulator protein blaR1